jgi:hypothetical protein
MKFKIELLNYYMFIGWILILAGLMGILYYFTSTGEEIVLGFATSSLVCGALLIYLGYSKKRVFKKK